jgi:hypothetical protein
LLNGFKSDREARRALAEIERLLRDAEAAGLALDPWLIELAEELRAALPEMDRAGAARRRSSGCAPRPCGRWGSAADRRILKIGEEPPFYSGEKGRSP